METCIPYSINFKIHTMNKSGPIVIIEDDIDDQEILSEIFKECREIYF